MDVAVVSIAHQADDLYPLAIAVIRRFFEEPPYGMFVVQEFLCKSLVHEGHIRIRIAVAEVPAAEKRNFHRIEPSGRDIQEVSEVSARGSSVDGDGVVPIRASQQWPC